MKIELTLEQLRFIAMALEACHLVHIGLEEHLAKEIAAEAGREPAQRV